MQKPIRFVDLYQEYFPKVLAQVQRDIGASQAQDVTQEVFLKIHTRLPQFRGEAQLSTWIFRIARNTCLDLLRQKPLPLDSYRELQAVGSTANPEEELETKEMSQCLRLQLNDLPEEFKTVLELADILGLTNQEIADHLGLSLDNAKIRLHRARAQLKQILVQRCHLYHNEQSQLVCDRKSGTERASQNL